MSGNSQLIQKLLSTLNTIDQSDRENKLLMRQHLKRYQKTISFEERLKFQRKIINETIEYLRKKESPQQNSAINRNNDIVNCDEE